MADKYDEKSEFFCKMDGDSTKRLYTVMTSPAETKDVLFSMLNMLILAQTKFLVDTGAV